MRKWRTTIPLPAERCEEVIEKIREVACPTEIVIEVEADDLWDARGKLDEVFQEVAALTGTTLTMTKPTEVE